MKRISIDIETFSSVDLGKCGVYKYAESEDFEILLFSYSVDEGEVCLVDLANGEKIPKEILAALSDESIEKWAFNANFERVCLSRFIGEKLSPRGWYCTMVWSAYLGLPLSLEKAGEVLRLDKKKLKEGKALIRYFSIPCKPSKNNNMRNRNMPYHDKDKWLFFKNYNIRDVETEMQIKKKLSAFPMPRQEWENYWIDQDINDRGILIDEILVDSAIKFDEMLREENLKKAERLTKLENPNSPLQLKAWLDDKGVKIDSLSKDDVEKALKTATGDIKEVLVLRQELSKSSVRKYNAMKNVRGKDNRARGLIQFYGANRSGRYSGRLIQVQNLRRNSLKDLELSRDLLRDKEYKTLEMLYESPSDVLSQLIRTAFIPKEGTRFIVSDFSAIEARILAWLAGERWVLDAFEKGEDIYCKTASRMFKVPVKKHGENSHLRQKGKIATLACIAEGELVLTDKGLVEIENITKAHKLWDGENWVSHDGVIYKGIGEVIEYDGLRATKDHIVWIEGKKEPIQFGQAAKSCSHLLQTGDGRRAIRMGENYKPRKKMGKKLENNQCKTRLYDIRNAGKNNRFTVSGKLVHNCGYQGSLGALKAMGGLDMGLTEEELQAIVDSWREANPNIVRLWWDIDTIVKRVVKTRAKERYKNLVISYEKGILFIELPSKRRLAYPKAKIGINRFGGESAFYEGMVVGNKWDKQESYGGKFVENIVQAIARDILAEAMKRLERRGFNIVMHIHDEVVIETDSSSVEEINEIMSIVPSWASGLLLDADGFECEFYKKD